MALYLPQDDQLKIALNHNPDSLLIVCYCAAWCDTCTEYRLGFASLAAQHPEWVFVWADIEETPDLLDDEDVENFPTILIERQGQTLFFGTMLPHTSQLKRLAQNLSEPDADPFEGPAPDNVRDKLRLSGF